MIQPNDPPESRLSRRGGWVSARIGRELMMMNAESSVYLTLSGAGEPIWELLEQPRTVTELCQALARSYAVEPAGIRAEVLAFLELLQQHHALAQHPPALE